MMSATNRRALAILFVAALSQGVALSQSPLLPTESSLSRNPALIEDWANRLQADDLHVRATTKAVLIVIVRDFWAV